MINVALFCPVKSELQDRCASVHVQRCESKSAGDLLF